MTAHPKGTEAIPQDLIYRPGLEGVIAAETRLSRVDGAAGTLLLAGYAVEDLAPRASFEETVFLFWNLRLPDVAELETLRRELAASRDLPGATVDLLRAAAGRGVSPMVALRMAAASLDLAEPPGADRAERDMRRDAVRLVASLPSIVAAHARLSRGEEPVAPDPELGHAASFLHLLEGERPSTARARALETYLNTVVDHGLNASTFAARVVQSTRSDLVSAVVAALGALKGPLHGGAPGPVLDTLLEIGRAERAEEILRAKLARGERLMGFGHRVYQVRDPRAEVLRAASRRLAEAAGDEAREIFALADEVERVALRLLAEHKPGRRLETNVEFATALLLHAIGLPKELFTSTFAVGRVVGWTAHCFEHARDGRLLRPRAAYVGAQGEVYREIGERG